jgi:hypothetical protein
MRLGFWGGLHAGAGPAPPGSSGPAATTLVVLLTAGDLHRMRGTCCASGSRCWLSAVRAPGRRPAKTPIRLVNGPCGRSVQLGHRGVPGQKPPGQPTAGPCGAILRGTRRYLSARRAREADRACGQHGRAHQDERAGPPLRLYRRTWHIIGSLAASARRRPRMFTAPSGCARGPITP